MKHDIIYAIHILRLLYFEDYERGRREGGRRLCVVAQFWEGGRGLTGHPYVYLALVKIILYTKWSCSNTWYFFAKEPECERLTMTPFSVSEFIISASTSYSLYVVFVMKIKTHTFLLLFCLHPFCVRDNCLTVPVFSLRGQGRLPTPTPFPHSGP